MGEIIKYIHERPKDRLDTIPFNGFNPEQAGKVRSQLGIIGLPLDNVRSVNYRPNPQGMKNLLGTFQPDNGEFTLYESLKGLPPQAQQKTIIHELAHGSSPFDRKNAHLYGGRESMEQSKKYVAAVARQTAMTRKYLDGYHAFLHRQLEEGQIDERRFVEETHGILVELRFDNPAHLAQVEAAQHKKLKESGIKPVHLVSKPIDGHGVALSGLDANIMKVMPGINTYEGLQKHIKRVKESVAPPGKEPTKLLRQEPRVIFKRAA